MKIYVRSNYSKYPDSDMDMILDFEVIFYNVKSPITSSITEKDGRYFITVRSKDGSRVSQEIKEEFYIYVKTVLDKIEELGFQELDTDKSNGSDSLYLYFARKTEFDEQKIKVIFTMRVSNHDLPLWERDKSKSKAEARQKSFNEHVADDYRWINNDPDSDIEVISSYVKFDGTDYNDIELLLDSIKRKINTMNSQARRKGV